MLAIKQDQGFAVVLGNDLQLAPQDALLLPADSLIERMGLQRGHLIGGLQLFRLVHGLVFSAAVDPAAEVPDDAAKPGA